jgi:hypothetical protein
MYLIIRIMISFLWSWPEKMMSGASRFTTLQNSYGYNYVTHEFSALKKKNRFQTKNVDLLVYRYLV